MIPIALPKKNQLSKMPQLEGVALKTKSGLSVCFPSRLTWAGYFSKGWQSLGMLQKEEAAKYLAKPPLGLLKETTMFR
jgi:hypothetical protein